MKHATTMGLPALLALSVSAPARQDAAALTAESLAYGLEITATSEQAVQTLLIPAEVYGSVTSPDLHDLAVFNAAGEQVPHAVRSRSSQELERGSAEVPLFPIHSSETDGSLPTDLSLQVTRTADGSVLDVRTFDALEADARKTDPGGATIAAYVIDASQLEDKVVGLTLEHSDESENYLARYAIEGSRDLASWDVLVPEAAFARLDHGGARLERNRVSFASAAYPYLRIRWLEHGPPDVLTTARLELSPRLGAPEWHTLQLEGRARPGAPSLYDFPSPGLLPVGRVQLLLPTPNTLIEGTLRNAPDRDGPWRSVIAARFYRIADSSVVNAAYDIGLCSAPYWSLHVASKGGGLGSGQPTLELSYLPHQLAFVARGEGPFTLAYGGHDIPNTGFDWAALTAGKAASLPTESVSYGRPIELSGPAALLPPLPPDTTTKKLVLWSVLLGGLGLLGWISLRLVRQMNA